MTKRYFIYLSYNGTNYCGWQNQPNGSTVQGTLEKALSTIFRSDTSIVGAGRTDAGVHARQMVAHFDVDSNMNLDLNHLISKLNSLLPHDIAIQQIVRVRDDAHARFDATSRLYKYYITTMKDPFLYQTYYRYRGNLDLAQMNSCTDILFEYDDFTSFSKLHTDVKTNLCQIMHAQWEIHENCYIFTIQANRFLRNMVRSIVGTLIEAGKGRLDQTGMRRIIEAKDRSVAGTSVPAHALFLEQISYPKEIIM